MGQSTVFRCANCGNSFTLPFGQGMRPLLAYQECVEGLRAGRYGDEWKVLTAGRKRFTVSEPQIRLYYCKSCELWETALDFSLYAPKKWELRTFKDYLPYFARNEFKLLGHLPHKCPKCGQQLRPYDSANDPAFPVIRCKKCGHPAEAAEELLWD